MTPVLRPAERIAAEVVEVRREDVVEEPHLVAAARVTVVDDDAQCRDSIARLAERLGCEVRTYSSARAFFAELPPEGAGCMIVDAHLPEMDGLAFAHEVCARRITTPLIMVLAYPNVRLAVELMRAHVFDVLEKPLYEAQLRGAVEEALEHLRAMHAALEQANRIRTRYTVLTRRERQVLDLVVAGETSRDIAAELQLCERTIEIYRSRIKKKMHTRNAAELVRVMNCVAPPMAEPLWTQPAVPV
jgi:FixJ family two-component response regulator